VQQLDTDVSDMADIYTMDMSHTDDGVQLVARCRETDGDGGAGCLFVGGICSLGTSLPLLVVVGGHCVWYGCEYWIAPSQSTDNLSSPNFLQKRLRLLQFLDRPRVMQHGPCEPCHLSAVTCACGSRLPNRMKPCFLCRRAQQLRLQPVETRVTK
jgi:hypothetical protein